MNLLRRMLVGGLFACVSFPTLAAMSPRELIEPEPVTIPEGVKQEDVAKVIKRSLVGRDWSMAKVETGYIEGQLNVRQHMLKVGITFDTKMISMKYIDSVELGYREERGKRFIHPKYRNWTNNVMSDIRKNLSAQLID